MTRFNCRNVIGSSFGRPPITNVAARWIRATQSWPRRDEWRSRVCVAPCFSRSLSFKSESRASEMITNVFRAVSNVYRDASVARNLLMNANIANISNRSDDRLHACEQAPAILLDYITKTFIIVWCNRGHTYIHD